MTDKHTPKLLKALEDMIASSDTVAHAAPGALDGLPNARQIHRQDIEAREQARAAIKAAKKSTA